MRKPTRLPPRRAPSQSMAELLQAGLRLHQSGRAEEAAGHYQRVLAAEPRNPAANHLLGLVHLQRGRHDLAVDHIARAVAARPDDAQYLCNLGVALNGAGRPEEAVPAFQRALAANPGFAEAYSNLGMAYRALSRFDEAVGAYRQAVALKPAEAGFHYNLGNVLGEAGFIVEAEAAYREALRLRPGYAPAVNALAGQLYDRGRPAEGLQLVDAALALAPNDAVLHMRRGRLLEQLGRLEDAVGAYGRSLALRPGFGEAHQHRAHLRRHAHRDADVDAMQALFSDADAPLDDRVFAGFGLGKALTDLGEHEAAVDTYLAVNRLHRERIVFSLDQARAELRADVERFAGLELSRPGVGHAGAAPIFVVGLPRSGKSTLEAILARHPDVAPAGELPTLSRLFTQLMRQHGEVRAIPTSAYEAVGRAYMEEAGRSVPQGRIVVDTMPSNYRHIGLIRAALPDARIVWCRRAPAAHCVAILEKYLTGRGYEYAFDLDELVAYHAAYRDAAVAWRSVAGDAILELDLADLRADPDARLREVADFCGLSWEGAVSVDLETEPQLGGWSAERLARNRSGQMAAWYRAAPWLAALA